MRTIRRNQARRGSGRVRAPGPTGVTPITGYLLSPRCRALSCAETKREAIPKRRQSARDDRAVLIASPRVLAARPQGVAADRKVRGSRKRGYRKPGRKSGCPVPPFAPRPGRGASLHAAACISPAAARQHFSRRRRRQKRHSPSEGENPTSREWGQPRLLRQGRRNGGTVRTLPRREKKTGTAWGYAG